jgi:hypothetical protein
MTFDSRPGESEITPGDGLTGGRMTWAEAVSGPLAGCVCLWQDLDGLHVEPPPAGAPPTSILWGWRDDSVLVRARLDGDVAYIAVLDEAAVGTDTVVIAIPWALNDGRVAAAVAAAGAGRGPAPGRGGVGTRYEQLVLGGIGTGPVTFVRPTRDA